MSITRSNILVASVQLTGGILFFAAIFAFFYSFDIAREMRASRGFPVNAVSRWVGTVDPRGNVSTDLKMCVGTMALGFIYPLLWPKRFSKDYRAA